MSDFKIIFYNLLKHRIKKITSVDCQLDYTVSDYIYCSTLTKYEPGFVGFESNGMMVQHHPSSFISPNILFGFTDSLHDIVKTHQINSWR